MIHQLYNQEIISMMERCFEECRIKVSTLLTTRQSGVSTEGDHSVSSPARGKCRERDSERSFFRFVNSVAEDLHRGGHPRTCETYLLALKSFMSFRRGEDLPISSVDSAVMQAYEGWLTTRGATRNTISFYMRCLRAAYNRGVERGLTHQRNPFRHVYTGVEKTNKRALSLAQIRRIRDLDLSSDPQAEFARDLFMLSFYLRGMAFVDMAYLRKDDIAAGMLSYHRQKTGQRLSVRWERQMSEIVGRYSPEGEMLLPIITDSAKDTRQQYLAASQRVNYRLKRIGAMLSLPLPLTIYVARHSWASIARSKNIPLHVISDALGHDSQATTQIYLASLDDCAVDKANSLIIKSL